MFEMLNEPAAPVGDGGLVRLRIDIAYDGTEFAGWAIQPGQRTVQQTIEQAIATILQLDPPPRLTCAGRTDAGVHARGQVAHVDLPRAALPDRLEFRLCSLLPPDVTVTALSFAPVGFDARFSALSRRYSYTVCDGPGVLDPLRRHDVLAHAATLDLDTMNQAGNVLLGEHNFAAFCRRRVGATTIRKILELNWERTSEPDRFAVLTIKADAFCHSMVRSLVGAMLAVGDGRKSAAWLAGHLAATERPPDIRVARPRGLVLEHVEYPPAADLAARAITTRATRVAAPTWAR